MSPPRIVALFGPTGVGKTAVAVALAQRLRARGEDPVAVSADALQVYRGLQLLTGAATPAQRASLEHRLIDFVGISERFSAGDYAALAHADIDGLLAAGRRPIVVGGTGLYLRAALAELDLRPEPALEVRERWEAELRARGPAALHATLAQRAPWAAEGIDPADGRRLVRALELDDAGQLQPRDAESQLWTGAMRRPTCLVGLVMDRAALRERIDARVDQLVAAGAAREVAAAHAAGASVTARQALGFDELLVGDVDALKRRTRAYAKRQLTWMRKLADVHTIDVTGREPAAVSAQIAAIVLGQSPST